MADLHEVTTVSSPLDPPGGTATADEPGEKRAAGPANFWLANFRLANFLGTSIRRRLIAAMVLVVVVTLVLTVVISNRVTAQRLEAQTGGSVQAVASRTADLLSQTLVENVHLVQTLAGVGQVVAEVERANALYELTDPETGEPIDLVSVLEQREEDWQKTAPYSPEVIRFFSNDNGANPIFSELQRFQDRFSRHVELLVTDRRGALIAATTRTQNFYFGAQGWWQTTTTTGGTVFVGPPVEDPDTGVISVLLGVPVIDSAGQAIGALCSALDVREVLDILGRVELGATGVARVYDENGIAIFDPGKPRLGTDPLPRDLAGADVLAARAPSWLRGRDLAGADAIFGYAKPVRTAGIPGIDALGWTTVASQDADEALQAVNLVTLIQIGVALVVAILAIVGSFVLSRLLTRQIGHIRRLFDEIHAGNYQARARVESRDELGRMTEDLNEMLDNTLTLIQSREERDSIQGSVVRLLEEVADVAKGDLTVRAEVTPDITGAIADSFNYMIAELRRIIGDAQETSIQVTSAADTIKGRMEQLASGSSSQSQQILDTSERLQQMVGSIQRVSENAEVCSGVAGESLQNARQGTEAVERTIAGMNAIRHQVREASKRLKRLGESSQEIGQIVKLISEVSDRTSILALNASIQAAAAGEAGSSFAVVADEIEELAERSAEATQRIGTLIKTVQVETAEAMAAMEDTTREVVGGSEVANDAGRALEQIRTVSHRLAELVASITQTATEQAKSSEILAGSMSNISQITQQTAFGTRQAAHEAEDLAQQADQLRNSVRRFTVPAKVA